MNGFLQLEIVSSNTKFCTLNAQKKHDVVHSPMYIILVDFIFPF